MTSPIWHVDEQGSHLRLEHFSARLEFDRPERGLTDLRAEGFPLGAGSVLGLALPKSAGTIEGGPLRGYERGRDLVVAWGGSEAWPVRVDVLWRAMSPAEASGLVAGVDLIVSVGTDLLDSRPELAVRSELTPTETLRWVGPDAASFAPCRLESPSPITLKSGGGPDCLAFRLSDAPFTYGEMSHPADSYGTILDAASDGSLTVEIRHRLFAERLEKGVILRARVRGVLVERADDLRSIAACCAAFAAADPPLGT